MKIGSYQAYIWGNGKDGQLGLGDEREEKRNDRSYMYPYTKPFRSRDVPVLLPSVPYTKDKWQQIACGIDYTVGVTSKGDLCSWGNDKYGRPARDKYNSGMAYKPMFVDKSIFPKKVKYVTCGTHHTVVLTTDGDLYTWYVLKILDTAFSINLKESLTFVQCLKRMGEFWTVGL